MSQTTVQITDSSFETDVLQADKLTVAKLDIDSNPNTPPKFGIRGIPTLMIFKGGDVVGTKVGAMSKSQLTAFIDETI
jgi:thioredoxin 1